MKLSIEEAVKIGLENSVQLKQVLNQIDLSEVADKRANYLSRKLKSGSDKISDSRDRLNAAQNALNTGVAPSNIHTEIQPGITIEIQQGQNIEDAVNSQLGMLSDEQRKAIVNSIKQGVQKQIDAGWDQLRGGEQALINALEEAGATFSDKLSINDIGSLSLSSTRDLMTTMSGISYEVTKSSYDIYRNQIALLIQKSYYDVLKAQKLLESKKKAMERAEKQYQFAKEGYEAGMKAKDDMLLANTYYKGTQIEYQKALGDLNNAMIELKKNMNIPLDSEIELSTVLADEVEKYDLQEGIESGLKNRLEILKAAGEVVIYNTNFDSVRKKYPSNTFQYREAELLKEKAALAYEQTRIEVESSIRKSYETLKSTGQMLETSKEMVQQAKESLEIAEYKYKEGFAIENSLLKKLDLESAAGTIVEVLAAEENLAQVEETVIEITYSYNLARMKYLNDIGKFIY